MPTLFRAILALAPIFSIATAACTSSNPPFDAGPGNQVCPSTIVEATASTNGDAGEGLTNQCHVAGYICVIGFACGSFTQQAGCTCTLQPDKSYKFVCLKAADGTTVPDGVTDPSTLCTPVDDAGTPDTCPTDDTTATGTPCHTSGEICYYKGATCTGVQVQPTDTCQCKNAAGDAGQAILAWSCEINACQ